MRGGTIIACVAYIKAFISIHPPRAGRDDVFVIVIRRTQKFQSTRPVRGGTILAAGVRCADEISIHPPRAGRDVCQIIGNGLQELAFQSTRPVRGGTYC